MNLVHKHKIEEFMKDNNMSFSCIQDMDDSRVGIYKLGIVFNTLDPETGHDPMTIEKATEILSMLGKVINRS